PVRGLPQLRRPLRAPRAHRARLHHPRRGRRRARGRHRRLRGHGRRVRAARHHGRRLGGRHPPRHRRGRTGELSGTPPNGGRYGRSMTRPRLPAVGAVLALGLSGCALAPPGSALGTASPSASAAIRVEPELAEELMREALPSAADAVEVYETAGLDGPSFASDWSVVDHDARRVTRVLRDWQTPGWADPSL